MRARQMKGATLELHLLRRVFCGKFNHRLSTLSSKRTSVGRGSELARDCASDTASKLAPTRQFGFITKKSVSKCHSGHARLFHFNLCALPNGVSLTCRRQSSSSRRVEDVNPRRRPLDGGS
jgi:hypothetical protein